MLVALLLLTLQGAHAEQLTCPKKAELLVDETAQWCRRIAKSGADQKYGPFVEYYDEKTR